MDSFEIVVIAVITFAALLGGYLLARRKRNALSSSPISQPDRWVVLEIERKNNAEDGFFWEVHDNCQLREHRSEAAQ